MKMSKNLVLRREDPSPRKHQVRIPLLLLLPPFLPPFLPSLLFPLLLWWWRSFISTHLQLREVLIERMPFPSRSLYKAESVISHRSETAAHLWPCILQIWNPIFSFLSFSSYSSRAFFCVLHTLCSGVPPLLWIITRWARVHSQFLLSHMSQPQPSTLYKAQLFPGTPASTHRRQNRLFHQTYLKCYFYPLCCSLSLSCQAILPARPISIQCITRAFLWLISNDSFHSGEGKEPLKADQGG